MRGICSTLVAASMSVRMRSSTLHADVLVRHLAAAEAQRDLDLVALLDERLHGAHLHLIVVLVDVRADLDLLDLDDFLLLLGFVLLLLLLVFELAEVEDLHHRRLGVRADLQQVEARRRRRAAAPRGRSSRPASRRPGRSGAPGGRGSPRSRGARRGSAGRAWVLWLWSSPVAVTESPRARPVQGAGARQRAVSPSCRGAIKRSRRRSAARSAAVDARRAQIGRRRLGRKPRHRLGQRQHLLRLAAEPAQRHRALLRLLAGRPRRCTGTCCRLCSRTLALIFWLARSSCTASPAAAQRRRDLVARSRRRRRRWSPPPPAPAPARAGSGRHTARSGCRGSARSCRGWRGAASPGGGGAPSSPTYSASSRSGSTKSTCSVPHCQSRPIASRSTNSSLGP